MNGLETLKNAEVLFQSNQDSIIPNIILAVSILWGFSFADIITFAYEMKLQSGPECPADLYCNGADISWNFYMRGNLELHEGKIFQVTQIWVWILVHSRGLNWLFVAMEQVIPILSDFTSQLLFLLRYLGGGGFD